MSNFEFENFAMNFMQSNYFDMFKMLCCQFFRISFEIINLKELKFDFIAVLFDYFVNFKS